MGTKETTPTWSSRAEAIQDQGIRLARFFICYSSNAHNRESVNFNKILFNALNLWVSVAARIVWSSGLA